MKLFFRGTFLIPPLMHGVDVAFLLNVGYTLKVLGLKMCSPYLLANLSKC